MVEGAEDRLEDEGSKDGETDDRVVLADLDVQGLAPHRSSNDGSATTVDIPAMGPQSWLVHGRQKHPSPDLPAPGRRRTSGGRHGHIPFP